MGTFLTVRSNKLKVNDEMKQCKEVLRIVPGTELALSIIYKHHYSITVLHISIREALFQAEFSGICNCLEIWSLDLESKSYVQMPDLLL